MSSMSSKRFPFGLYKTAPTDYVVKYRNGRAVAEGTGQLYLITPWHTFARVPATEITIPVSFTELSADRLNVFVQGDLHVRLDVKKILARMDFTVDPWTNAWRSTDFDRLREEAGKALQRSVRAKIATRTLEDAIVSVSSIETDVISAISADKESFLALGLEIVSLFLTSIRPANKELERAVEAKKREEMLAAADKAVSERRMGAAENDRELKQYEAETGRLMEEQRAELIEIRNANIVSEAVADADAIEKRLAPYRNMEGNVLLALAIQEMAKQGVGELNITPDLLSAVGRAATRANGSAP